MVRLKCTSGAKIGMIKTYKKKIQTNRNRLKKQNRKIPSTKKTLSINSHYKKDKLTNLTATVGLPNWKMNQVLTQ
jgi:hypothetical protein